MSKYRPLADFLKDKGGAAIPLSFAEIEKIIGAGLPPSARKHRAWWSNNPRGSVVTMAWRDAGYRTTQVDLGEERVTFLRETADAET